jgi:Fe-S oxidoreductase
VLWFVGDYPSYHPVQPSTRAFASLLNRLGVDFAILGYEENSDGDSQRLAGERGLFEVLAEKNGKVMRRYQFNEIITTDPHAYNALKNIYPSLGIRYPVRHSTQFLAERLDQLKPSLTGAVKARVAFHDPCYLGRVNKIFDEPRQLLQAIPGISLVEMPHRMSNSLCCGGGGGGMWIDGYLWKNPTPGFPNGACVRRFTAGQTSWRSPALTKRRASKMRSKRFLALKPCKLKRSATCSLLQSPKIRR